MVLVEQDVAVAVSRELSQRTHGMLAQDYGNADNFERIIDKHKHQLQQTKPIFDKIIENSGSVYGPILAQCKQRYDTYIQHICQRHAVKRIRNDLQAQRQHEASAIDIYMRRHAELNRKIEILKQKHELSLKELASWRTKTFKLKLQPDIIETDPCQEERERRELHTSTAPNYHQIPGLELDRLSLEYTGELKKKWRDRVDRQKSIVCNNFVTLADFGELTGSIHEMRCRQVSEQQKVKSLMESTRDLEQFLNALRASSNIKLTSGVPQKSNSVIESLPETYQEDSQLLQFWEYLQDEDVSVGIKAVTLALCNRRFHVAGTMVIFIDYDLQRQKIDPHLLANTRVFNPDSLSLQFAQGLNQQIDYDGKDAALDSALTDLVVELLREKADEVHLSRASSDLAAMLAKTNIGNDRHLASQIYQKRNMFNEYLQTGGTDYSLLSDTDMRVTDATWSALITRHSSAPTQFNLKNLSKLYQTWYSRQKELKLEGASASEIAKNLGQLSTCKFLSLISDPKLRDYFIKCNGGLGALLEDDDRDWDSSKAGQELQANNAELFALMLIKSVVQRAFEQISDHEKNEFEFYV